MDACLSRIETLRARMTLYTYQRKGLEWLLSRELQADEYKIRGGILADEMGLGKTVQMLALTHAHVQPPTLIVCPVSVVHQWKEECERFLGFSPLVVNVANLKASILKPGHASGSSNPHYIPLQTVQNAQIVIAPHSCFNNHSLRNYYEEEHTLLQAQFGRVVFDEAHHLKDPNSTLFHYATQIQAPLRWCLTGTPVVSKKVPAGMPKSRAHKTDDIASLVGFLSGRAKRVKSTGKRVSERTLRTGELSLMLRRTKADPQVQQELARTQQEQGLVLNLRLLDFEEPEAEAYGETYRQGRAMLGKLQELEGGEVEFAHVLAVITKLRQQCVCSTKMEALQQCFEEHPPGTKSLVFCNWMDEVGQVCAALQTMDSGPATVMQYHGSMSRDQREENIKAFTASPGSAAMVMQIQAGSVGLNLESASRVYVMSPHWSAATEMQAISRAHRTTTQHIVTVHRFVIRDTIEEFVHKRQQSKLDTAAAMLGDARVQTSLQDSEGITVTWSDLQKLFDCELYDEMQE